MGRIVTHYLRGYHVDDCWVPLYFITQDANGKYYFGFEGVELPSQDVGRRLAAGELTELKIKWPIEDDQTLWKTPYGDVWLTSGSDPLEDTTRVLLEPGTLPNNVSKKEILFRRPRSGTKPELIYVPDNFVQSDIYHRFVDGVAETLAELNGAVLVPQGGKVVEWDILASKLEGDTVDFCGLPYNLHESRARRFSVIPFGVQPTYTYYFSMHSRKRKGGFALFRSHLSPLTRLQTALNDNSDLQIGVFVDTTAAHEVLSLFRFFPRMAENDGLAIKPTVEELKRWIREDPDNRVIICDHSIAAKLDQVDRKTASMGETITWEHSTDRATVTYQRPLPVGFVYPRDDIRWGEDIRRAAQAAIQHLVSSPDDYDALQESLAPLKVNLLTIEQLCQEYRIPPNEVRRRLA